MEDEIEQQLATLVSKLLPDASEATSQGLIQDEKLFEICTDVHNLTESLRYFEEDPLPNKDRIAQCTELLQELEQELLDYLQKRISDAS